MKPKLNLTDIPERDRCQTPSYGFAPLLPYIPLGVKIWEPAAGEGNLVKTYRHYGFDVVATDLLTGQDFFCNESIPAYYDIQITNVPFSIKYKWLKRCYELGQPFALLMPVETIGAASAQRLFDKYGVEIIYMDKRINFKMPSHRTWEETLKPTVMRDEFGNILYYPEGHKKAGQPKMTSGSQFPTAWWTHGLNIGKEMTFAKLERSLQHWELSAPSPILLPLPVE